MKILKENKLDEAIAYEVLRVRGSNSYVIITYNNKNSANELIDILEKLEEFNVDQKKNVYKIQQTSVH